ncbi:SDR family oxidoreductase [Alkalihalobacillus trypoxylicola]|uniref:NAD-dependent dehydratase n=1 Tax=Alkalihalobacillus trypoxylicola TaxID=519424 RepID=A0A162EAG0_9BACI|nr:SDR family oxidoreductase [Alkalihalobacillus trypoxylicola]KYG32152.1 NAD-dependent dehydratase [Alkalihalobacillus trypoxylicola]
MNILVVGANGQVAKETIKELKAQGHQVKAMIRNEKQSDLLKKQGADEIVIADLEEDITHAFVDVDGVIFAAGSGGKTGADKTILIDLWGAMKVIDQTVAHSIKRFVMLSSMGTVDPDKSDQIRHYLVAKKLADDYLKQTDLDYTIVRPGSLTNDKPTHQIKLEEEIEVRDNTITRADVASVLVAVLEKENTYQKTFEILNGDVDINTAIEQI